MRPWVFIGCAVVAAPCVVAAGSGLKPGLWETHVIKQVVDGRDMSAPMAGVGAQMQQAMANMPPEQRARMEAMMKQHAGPSLGSNGALRMCITADQANSDKPVLDRQARCEPTTFKRSGNRTMFEMNCTTNGIKTTGKGETTMTGSSVTTVMDMTSQMANGPTHVTHTESEMKFLGADCGEVKPMVLPKTPEPHAAPKPKGK